MLRCFAFLAHAASNLQCRTVSTDSPDWFHDFSCQSVCVHKMYIKAFSQQLYVFLTIGILFLMACTVQTQQWNNETKEYRWTQRFKRWEAGAGLTKVPRDIPTEALRVDLYRNQIEVIRENSFSNLSVCEQLQLWRNKIHTIERGAWNGLVSLNTLYLNNNEIKVLHNNTFNGLTKLQTLHMHRNEITHVQPKTFDNMNLSTLLLDHNELSTLPWTVFGKEHPAQLTLRLRDNPVVCNRSVCWIKQGEQQGWVTWRYNVYKPDCRNTNTDWDNISLSCSHLG